MGPVHVVQVALALQRDEEDHAPVGRPLDERELQGQLAAPYAVPVDGADDDGAVLVNDANLRPVRGPLHVAHDAPVAVVDHLLEPHPLVQHPDDDEAVGVSPKRVDVRVLARGCGSRR